MTRANFANLNSGAPTSPSPPTGIWSPRPPALTEAEVPDLKASAAPFSARRTTSSARRLPGALPLALAFLVWPAAALAFVFSRIVVRALGGSRGHVLAAVVLGARCALTLHALDRELIAFAVLTAFNAPFTLPAIGWGLAHGGTLEVAGGLFVVTRMEDGYGPRVGVTVGNVFLTGRAEPGAALRDHETVHARQWAVLGALTAPLYGLANLLAGDDPARNVFEVHAGLKEGGYPTAGA